MRRPVRRRPHSAESVLKTHMIGYEKTRKFFTRKNSDIYLKLKPYLNTAISHARSLGHYDPNIPEKAMCEMEYLFLADEIRSHYL